MTRRHDDTGPRTDDGPQLGPSDTRAAAVAFTAMTQQLQADNARLRAFIADACGADPRAPTDALIAEATKANAEDDATFSRLRERAVKLRAALWAIRDVTSEVGSPSHDVATAAIAADETDTKRPGDAG